MRYRYQYTNGIQLSPGHRTGLERTLSSTEMAVVPLSVSSMSDLGVSNGTSQATQYMQLSPLNNARLEQHGYGRGPAERVVNVGLVHGLVHAHVGRCGGSRDILVRQ